MNFFFENIEHIFFISSSNMRAVIVVVDNISWNA